MATPKTTDRTRRHSPSHPDDDELDAMVEVNGVELGRHRARVLPSTLPVSVVLLGFWGNHGDISRTAVHYYGRHQALFDAFFLVKEEEDNAPSGY